MLNTPAMCAARQPSSLFSQKQNLKKLLLLVFYTETLVQSVLNQSPEHSLTYKYLKEDGPFCGFENITLEYLHRY